MFFWSKNMSFIGKDKLRHIPLNFGPHCSPDWNQMSVSEISKMEGYVVNILFRVNLQTKYNESKFSFSNFSLKLNKKILMNFLLG